MAEVSRRYADLFEVATGSGEFSTCLKARQRFEAGAVLAPITGLKTSKRHYTTAQCGLSEEDNIKVDTELVYVNHSCDPNTTFDMSSEDPSRWHVRALKTIEVGDDITFFYPSTEWEMDQEFACRCGAANCLGVVKGGRYLTLSQLVEHGPVSPWVRERATAGA